MGRGARFAWERQIRACDFRPYPPKKVTVIAVSLTLATYFDGATLKARPSVATLAKGSGTNRDTVRRVTALLEEIGFLSIDRRGPGAGEKNTHHYCGVLLDTGKGAPGTPSIFRQRVPRDAESQGEKGSPEKSKGTPGTSDWDSRNTPNSNEQNKNSAAPADLELETLKQKHPDLWQAVLSGTRRRVEAGQDIRNPEQYSIPRFLEDVGKHRGETRRSAGADAVQTAIDACNLCNSGGRIGWETKDGPLTDKCTHNPNDYRNLDIFTYQETNGEG